MSVAYISARKHASNVIVTTGPDVCLTPVGCDMEPVAYHSIAYMSTAVRYSTKVRNNGRYDFQLNSRCETSEGHEPGVGRGTHDQGYLGPAHAKIASPFIYSEGFATVSHRDPGWVNKSSEGPIEPFNVTHDVNRS